MNDLLTRDRILLALDALADELHRRCVDAKLVLVGGGAMSLLYSARSATKDLDVYVVSPDAAEVRAAARSVALDLSLPDDWLNEGAKGFLVGFAEGPTVYDRPGLVVVTPAPRQLLAMKLSAGRIGVDYADVVVLLGKVDGTKEEVWAALEPHLVPGQQLKAQYIFEDLWDEAHELC